MVAFRPTACIIHHIKIPLMMKAERPACFGQDYHCKPILSVYTLESVEAKQHQVLAEAMHNNKKCVY